MKNEIQIQLDEGTFEIVHPFQVRDKKERIGIDTRNYFLNATVHYKHVIIVIRSNTVAGVRLKLVLDVNDHILLNETKFKKLNENGEAGLEGGPVENCYYQGIVNGDSTSLVAISTCNGLWGVIAFSNGTTLGIWPLDGGDRGRRHPHVLFRIKWTRDAACGAVTQTPAQFLPLKSGIEQASEMLKIKRDVVRNKYLELAVIADHNFMKDFNYTEREALDFILLSINIADLTMNRDLKIRLSVVYVELWLDAQRVDLHNDIQQTLTGAVDYTTGHIYHVEKDASVLFTGGFFANGEMLTSTFSSICTARAVGIVKAIDAYAVHSSALFLSHTLAHIVGIDHDSIECACGSNQPCNMNRQIGAIGSPFSWDFSKCSVARLQNILQSEHVQCLLSRPFQVSRAHQCGNGVVDGDEECDCGRRDECFDPCCDPISCTLRAHAQCASHQPCCHRCELRQLGYVCRESRSICDVAEVCDGKDGDCPADGHLIDGVLCGINGQCWKGNCSDAEQQCKNLWGLGAKSAQEPCYGYNQKGVEYGNCGKDRNGAFIACSEENRKCGTLHCMGGSALPQLSSLTSFNLQFLHENQQIQCKVITNSAGNDDGLVKEGTNCASGKICIEGVCVTALLALLSSVLKYICLFWVCVPLSQVSPPIHCPSNNLALQCSGHGDCTTTQRCLCYDGWAGVACDIRSNLSRRIGFPATIPPNGDDLLFPSFKVGRTLETSTLLGILLLVGIFLLLLLVCLLFCYRRRSSTDMQDARMHEKIEDEASDVNRAIKFGQMPSYREEKRKRKKNKRVYDALQRINEAAEERDSVSVQSIKSSSVVLPQNGLPNGVKNERGTNHHNDELPLTERGFHSSRASQDSNDSVARSQREPHQGMQTSDFVAHGSSRCLYNSNQLEFGNNQGTYAGSHTLSPRSINHALDIGPSYSPTRNDDYCNGIRKSNRHLHYLDKSGYATDSDLLPISAKYNNLRQNTNYNRSGSNGILSQCEECPMTPPLRLPGLQSISHLMRRLNPDENEQMQQDSAQLFHLPNGSSNHGWTDGKPCHLMSPVNPVSARQTVFGIPSEFQPNPPEPPPASADSGHPCSSTFGTNPSASSGSLRESPSLFSDAFKLDLSN